MADETNTGGSSGGGVDINASSNSNVVIGGNVSSGDMTILGQSIEIDYRYNAQRIENINTVQEFVTELRKIQEAIAALKAQPEVSSEQRQTIEVAEGQIAEALGEAQKPKPLAARITALMTSAKSVMESVAGGVTAAVGLGTALALLGQIALKLFGG